jgi:small subunit ribosomal protein S5
MIMGRRKFSPRRDEREPFNVDAWAPKTELGRRVKAREIVSVKEIFEAGKPILEHEIVDMLLPNLTDNVLEIKMTQRMTDCGRKSTYRVVALVGDGNGHVGIGVGRAAEVKPAIEQAIKYAKRNIMVIPLGCGSWECGCKTRHTVPITVLGHNGSVNVTVKPAPKGLGIAASRIVKEVLKAAGVRDAWSFTRGRTSSIYNTSMATLNALDSLNNMKVKGDWESRCEAKAEAAAPAASV